MRGGDRGEDSPAAVAYSRGHTTTTAWATAAQCSIVLSHAPRVSVHQWFIAAPSCAATHLKWVHIKQVVCIVQRRLLIIKGGKPHALKVPPVTLLTPHHDPHAAPLCHVEWLNHPRNLIHKGDCACDVVNHLDVTDLRGEWVGGGVHRCEPGLCVQMVHSGACSDVARKHMCVPAPTAWACSPAACTQRAAQT